MTADHRRPDVLVVGMHRSGTSAVAGALVAMGLAGPRADDVVAPAPANRVGYFESASMVALDELVLASFGGCWSAPPELPTGWADSAAAAAVRQAARRFVAEREGGGAMVLKDPRLCFTVPLWRGALPREPLAVVVVRRPGPVAQSLARRNGMPVALGLALWDRSLRQAVADIEGMATYVIDYDELVADPHATLGPMADFLHHGGLTVASPAGAASIHSELRHHHHDPEVDRRADELVDVYDVLRARTGAHRSWTPPELPAPPWWVSDVLTLSRSGQAVAGALHDHRRQLRWIKQSRLFRATGALWRATGRGPAGHHGAEARPSWRP